MTKKSTPLLEVRDLSVSFGMYESAFKRTALDTIKSLNLDIAEGEILAVAGSSGSGKSLLAHAVMGILPSNAVMGGRILYKGENLTPSLQKKLRGTEIVFIPQSVDFLDPLMREGKQAAGVKGSPAVQKETFRRYGLDDRIEKMYPFELSGGMARRVLISTAVTVNPCLIIADEPTSGLDEKLVMETLGNFRELARGGTSILLITHDIDLAVEAADRVAVFYAGITLEIAKAEDFKKGKGALRHPYSKALFDALPQNGFVPVRGSQPYAGNHTQGCPFAGRCSMRTASCGGEIKMRALRGGEVRCANAT